MVKTALRVMPHDDEIFAAALELPPAERSAFLLQTCSGDETLRHRVEALLRGHGQAGDFLKEPAVPRDETVRREIPAEMIGRYKLLGKIGEGGCGVVYEAEQQEPVRRRVALKVIKLGMDTNAVIARFQAERQALALMDHPNIARVYDAGATEAGRPYFVMELVRGMPITDYCDRNHLTPRQRIELFITVCSAIHHAHQKGIVHRDLKPSNVLVAMIDGAPVPKVIDFGVAKATQGRLTDETMYTAVEQFIGTPVYMSPEQADLGGLDIDSRSDIYSLGVLLYELLAGRPPFDSQTFAKAGVDSIRQKIRETEPPTPSTRVRTLSEADRAATAKSRGITPAALPLLLRGDLDWIVMRCLEKDRTRRYSTANDLALDLQRHLRHEPVAARPPSPVYVLGKFLRRHRPGMLAAGAAAAALVLGATWSEWRSVRPDASRQGQPPSYETEPQTHADEVAQLLARARTACTKLGFTPDDLANAEEIAKRATDLDSDSAEAWGMRARVDAMYLVRGWDLGATRIKSAQILANRCLALDPNNPDGLFALSLVMFGQANAADSGILKDLVAQAEALARRAVQADPDDGYYVRQLAFMIGVLGRGQESRALLHDAIQRNSRDPLLHYDLGTAYASMFGSGGASSVRLAAGVKELDAAYAIGNFGNPLIQKAAIVAGWKGDLVQMRSILDLLERRPLGERAAPRAVWVAMWGGLLERRPDRTFSAASVTAEDYLGPDSQIGEPKAFMLAEAHQLAGEENLAQRDWGAAEEVLQQRLQVDTSYYLLRTQIQLALAQAQMHRLADAAATMARAEAMLREIKDVSLLWWWSARYYAARGDPAAIPYLEKSVNHTAMYTANIVRLDPAFDKLRRLPEFTAFLARFNPAENAAAAPQEWPRDPELKRAFALIEGNESVPDDYALARDIADKALEKNPLDPEAATVLAWVENEPLLRGSDRSPGQRSRAKRSAERALQLAPEDPAALFAMALYLYNSKIELDRAEELLRQAIQLDPGQVLYQRILADVIFAQRPAEGVAEAEAEVKRFPRDALSHYELARHYRDTGNLPGMERELDATIALAPIANAMMWKARVLLWVHGDIAGMKALLDRVPERQRSAERVVLSRFVYAAISGQIDDGLEAVRSLPQAWIEDFDYIGPTALLTGDLLLLAGRKDLAAAQYEAALAEARRRKALDPVAFPPRLAETWSLYRLGRTAEARANTGIILDSLPVSYGNSFYADTNWWYHPLALFLLFGERDQAMRLMRTAAATAEGRAMLRSVLQVDPRMAASRADPEITALLAEPEPAGAHEPSESAKLTAQALDRYSKVGFLREDLALAEDMARRATELEPESAAAWGVRAGVQAAWIQRSWDFGEKRRQDIQAFANRALALDPNEPEALIALGHLLRSQGAYGQAEAVFRRAIATHPQLIRAKGTLAYMLSSHAGAGRGEEARALLRDALNQAPNDAILHYEMALTYASYGPGGSDPKALAESLMQLDSAIAARPFYSALLLKAILVGAWRGDLQGMQSTLDQGALLPLADRTEDRAVCLAMWAGLIEHRPDRVEASAALTARDYFEDAVMPMRPKAWPLALAHRIAGKDNLARRDWEDAEAVMRRRVRDQPDDMRYQAELAITLAWLGRRDEAAKIIAMVEPLWREAPTFWTPETLALYYGAMGDAKRASPYLKATIDRSPFWSRRVMPLDPWWDKLRGQPEFDALVKTPLAGK